MQESQKTNFDHLKLKNIAKNKRQIKVKFSNENDENENNLLKIKKYSDNLPDCFPNKKHFDNSDTFDNNNLFLENKIDMFIKPIKTSNIKKTL